MGIEILSFISYTTTYDKTNLPTKEEKTIT